MLFELLFSFKAFYLSFNRMWAKVLEFERSGLLSLARGGGGLGEGGERRLVILIDRKKRLFSEMETFLTEFYYFLFQVSDRTNLTASPSLETLLNLVGEAKSTFEVKIKKRKFISKSEFDVLLDLISSFLDCSDSIDWTTIVPESLLFQYCRKRSQNLTKHGRLLVSIWKTEVKETIFKDDSQLIAPATFAKPEPKPVIRNDTSDVNKVADSYVKETSESVLVDSYVRESDKEVDSQIKRAALCGKVGGEIEEEDSQVKRVVICGKEEREGGRGEGVVKMQVKVQRIYKGLLGFQGKLEEFWEEEDKTKFFAVERNLDEIFSQQVLGYSFLLKKSKEAVIELDEDDMMIIDLYKLVILNNKLFNSNTPPPPLSDY